MQLLSTDMLPLLPCQAAAVCDKDLYQSGNTFSQTPCKETPPARPMPSTRSASEPSAGGKALCERACACCMSEDEQRVLQPSVVCS